jgi:hypothetical protein
LNEEAGEAPPAPPERVCSAAGTHRAGPRSRSRSTGSSTLVGVLAVAIAMVACSGMVGGTLALFDGEATSSSTFTDAYLATPTGMTVTPSGNTFNLAWTSDSVDSGANTNTVTWVDNAGNSSCIGAAYANPTTFTGSTTSGTSAPTGSDGDVMCYQLASTFGTSWSLPSSDVSTAQGQLGFAATALALGGTTAGRVQSGDTLALTFNQPAGPALTTALTTTTNGTKTLAVSKLPFAVANGDSIVVTSGAHTQTFAAKAAAAVGATSISLTTATANFAYPIGSTVVDSSAHIPVCVFSVGTVSTTIVVGDTASCASTTDANTFGVITIPTQLTFTTGTSPANFSTSTYSVTGNTLTITLAGSTSVANLTSSSATATYTPSGGVTRLTSAAGTVSLCTGDAVLTTALATSPNTTALTVPALADPIAAGSVTVTSGAHTQTFTASAAAAGASSITVSSVAANFAYPVGSLVAAPALTQCDPTTSTDF